MNLNKDEELGAPITTNMQNREQEQRISNNDEESDEGDDEDLDPLCLIESAQLDSLFSSKFENINLVPYELSMIGENQWDLLIEKLQNNLDILFIEHNGTMPENVKVKILEILQSRRKPFAITQWNTFKEIMSKKNGIISISFKKDFYSLYKIIKIMILENMLTELKDIFNSLDKFSRINCLCFESNDSVCLLNIAIKMDSVAKDVNYFDIIDFLLTEFVDWQHFGILDERFKEKEKNIVKTLTEIFLLAIAHGNLKILDSFFKLKLNEIKTEDFFPVIHAVHTGNKEVLQALLEHGFNAGETAIEEKKKDESQDGEGIVKSDIEDIEYTTTPLKEAVILAGNAVSIIELLVKYGVRASKEIVDFVLKNGHPTQKYWILQYLDKLEPLYWAFGERRLITFEEKLNAADDIASLVDLQSSLANSQSSLIDLQQSGWEMQLSDRKKENYLKLLQLSSQQRVVAKLMTYMLYQFKEETNKINIKKKREAWKDEYSTKKRSTEKELTEEELTEEESTDEGSPEEELAEEELIDEEFTEEESIEEIKEEDQENKVVEEHEQAEPADKEMEKNEQEKLDKGIEETAFVI